MKTVKLLSLLTLVLLLSASLTGCAFGKGVENITTDIQNGKPDSAVIFVNVNGVDKELIHIKITETEGFTEMTDGANFSEIPLGEYEGGIKYSVGGKVTRSTSGSISYTGNDKSLSVRATFENQAGISNYRKEKESNTWQLFVGEEEYKYIR